MQTIYKRYEDLHSDLNLDVLELGGNKYNTFVVTNFRGGIGKTTLSFNLAYEMSRKYKTLFVDVCPQANFSELLLSNNLPENPINIHSVLLKKIMGEAWSIPGEDLEQALSFRVQDHNNEFRSGKICYAIPGSSELFLFPSQLYSQLNQYYSMTAKNKTIAVRYLLNSLTKIIEDEQQSTKTEKILIDTSPFFAGGTHLAWCAADALIIPVRVDEQSTYSLELTLKMLSDPLSDFNSWRDRAEIERKPKVQAIIMTHCGWNRKASHQIDGASRLFIERAVEICKKYTGVFNTDNPIDHFALLSDFHSSGKISGTKSIPIAKLEEGAHYTVDHRRLEVNKSVERYKKELSYAFNLID